MSKVRWKQRELEKRAYIQGRMSPYEQRLYERRVALLAALAKRFGPSAIEE